MAITDELREYVIDADGMGMTHGHAKSIYAIADRIDAEHETDVSTACRLAAGLDNDALAKRGYIALPLDADGVPIRIGDVVTCGATVWTVTRMKLLGEGWGICCTVYNEYGGSGTNVYPPSDLRHYHAPTVEDVLREFADAMSNTHPLDVPARIAEYAAKLRLAEEVDA